MVLCFDAVVTSITSPISVLPHVLFDIISYFRIIHRTFLKEKSFIYFPYTSLEKTKISKFKYFTVLEWAPLPSMDILVSSLNSFTQDRTVLEKILLDNANTFIPIQKICFFMTKPWQLQHFIILSITNLPVSDANTVCSMLLGSYLPPEDLVIIIVFVFISMHIWVPN